MNEINKKNIESYYDLEELIKDIFFFIFTHVSYTFFKFVHHFDLLVLIFVC